MVRKKIGAVSLICTVWGVTSSNFDSSFGYSLIGQYRQNIRKSKTHVFIVFKTIHQK